MIPYRTKSKILDLDSLKPDDIDIEDIAHQLALINRYNGATPLPYSVAQHSVICAQMAPGGYELAALLHDAHEYITGDIARPVARAVGYTRWITDWDELKSQIDRVIGKSLGIGWLCDPPEAIIDTDNRVLATEMVSFFGENYTDYEPYAFEITPAPSWEIARRDFLQTFERLALRV